MTTNSKSVRNQKIIADYNEGVKIADIAESNGVSQQTVFKVVRDSRESGAVTRAPRVRMRSDIDPNRNQRIVEMYLGGSTLNSIGEYFGLTRERIRQILNAAGIDRRTMTEHVGAARGKVMSVYGPMIDASFEEMRSISKVAEQFKDKVPSRWVHQRLESRRHEVLRSNYVPQVWSNEQIIDILRQASAGSGTLSIGMYREWRESSTAATRRPPTHSVIAWRFGSWRNAVTMAGLAGNIARREYKRKWTRDDALRSVAMYVDMTSQEGKRPTFSGYDVWSRDKSEHPSAAYVRHLTGLPWSQVVRLLSTRQGV